MLLNHKECREILDSREQIKQEAYDYLDKLLSTTKMKELGDDGIIEYSKKIDIHHSFRHRLTGVPKGGGRIRLTPHTMNRDFQQMFGR